MKKVSLWVVTMALTIFLTMPTVFAKNYGLEKAANTADYSTETTVSVYSITQTVITGILALVGFVFFGFFLYAGLRWLTARGDKNLIAKAKDTMISAIVGLAVMMAAFAITNFVFDQLNKTS